MDISKLNEKDIRLALEVGEIQLYYQPIVCARHDRQIGFEALARWVRFGSLVAPGMFLPVVSAYGLMPMLDRRVLEMALDQAKAWAMVGFGGYVSVNLSMNSLTPAFAEEAIDRVRQSLGARVVIEVTESEQAASPELVREALRRFMDAGLSVYLDDFGAGYSNMTYVLHYPVSGIKMDRMFIQALGQGTIGPVLAMITLARAEGLEVIAEGIETAAEREKLIDMGCMKHQGFYYAKPKPARDIVV